MIIGAPQQQHAYSESSRWYDRDGNFVKYVPYTDKSRAGELKPVTLREARKLGLLPSVTSVISILDKPSLTSWKIDTALDAYIAYPGGGKQQAIEDMYDVGRKAAGMGTAIHAGIENYLNNGPGEYVFLYPQVGHVVQGAVLWLARSGFKCQRAEHSFVSQLGYAGTVDLEGTLNGEPIIADFKTEDADTPDDFSFYEPEYPLQLAGYDVGLGRNRKRISIKISRTKPGLIATKVWQDKDKSWQETNERWDAAWLALHDVWQNVKNFYPSKEFAA